MSEEKPCIVIIGGGWHRPMHYGKLKLALEAHGFEVHCPEHPSTNQHRPPDAGLPEDTANMRSYVGRLVESGKRVVALLHSYGGQVGSNSLYGMSEASRKEMGLAGGVSDLIYMCSLILPEGVSMMDKVREMGQEALLDAAFDFAPDKTVLCRDARAKLIGDDGDEDEVGDYLAGLVRWNGQCMYDAISHCSWREIPTTYIYATADMTVPLEYQKSVVEVLERQGVAVSTYELATGHCPNLTATEGVVAAVESVVGARGVSANE